MNQLAPRPSPAVPTLVAATGEGAGLRFLEFFAAAIRNPHTRRAYSQATGAFLAWCATAGVPSLAAVQPLHVAAWIELQTREHSAPTAKQRLAALRHLFDWLVTGQVLPTNPAASVRGPRHSALKGKTPVLDATEARQLLDSIDVSTPAGQRDRALIALMVFSFARVGAALGMTVADVYTQHRRLWVRLHEKGGKRHEMPCHHTLEAYLHAYFDGVGIADDPKGSLFRTIGRGTKTLTRPPPAPGQRLRHDPAPRGGGRHRDGDRQPHLPSHRHHRLPGERRHAGKCCRHAQSRQHPHDATL